MGLVSSQPDEPRLPTGAAEAPTLDVSGDGPTESGDAPDSFDEILRRVVRPAASAALLEPGSELVGRFHITRVLGAGGMGTVYVARDATLGREVAIKVHHTAGGAQRLRREAVAMARLAHPNVVTVFEVGDLAGRPFVVMEYITGTTLRAHLAAARPGVRGVLALLIAAGEGLAAAHDAGLVHRDIKPENVLIGADGRARVGDFGLARELDSGDQPQPAATASASDLRTPVTQTGAVLGTPAYMAPEQFAGVPVDARADQFAFCVTAWEALWGERPFAGESFLQLNAAICLGQRRPPPALPKVPPRVRAALERGLSVDPGARFPGMHALLDAIRPPPLLRRRRWGLAAGLAIAGAAALALLPGRDTGPSCDAAGAAELAGLRGDLPELVARRGSPQIGAKAEKLLHDYMAGFRDLARQACRAERAREWSPDIAAQSRLCFTVVARTAALSLAPLDPARPMAVLRHLRRLPPEEHCRNQSHLVSRPPIPADPARLAALTEASALLGVGFDSIEDRDQRQLATALAALEASPAHGEPGIAAGLTVLRGWRAFDAGQIAQAGKLFVEAYYAGRAIDDEQILGVALGLLIEYGPDLGLAPAAVEDWQRTALADADRIRARSPWLAGRIYSVAAHAADLAGNAPRALELVARARDVLDAHDPSRIETYATEGAALIASGRVDDGVRAYEAAIAQRTAYAGADDPDLASLLSDYAASLLQAERLNQAMQAADRAAQIIAHVADPDDDRIDPIRLTLAGVLIGANQDDEALGLLDTARAHAALRLGESSTVVASIDTNLAAIYNARGDHDRAIAALASALAIDEKLLGPERLEVAVVLYNLAAAYQAKRDYPAALAAARRAAAIYQAKSPGSDRHRITLTMAALAANESRDFAQALALTAAALGFPQPAESPQTPAWTQLERARALVGVHRPAEARPLLVAARKAYAELNMSPRVRQVDELLAQLR